MEELVNDFKILLFVHFKFLYIFYKNQRMESTK